MASDIRYHNKRSQLLLDVEWVDPEIFNFNRYCKPAFNRKQQNFASFTRTLQSRIFLVVKQIFYAVPWKWRWLDRENSPPLTSLSQQNNEIKLPGIKVGLQYHQWKTKKSLISGKVYTIHMTDMDLRYLGMTSDIRYHH
jgi:hypothetical protein